jgi:hypothetical protein
MQINQLLTYRLNLSLAGKVIGFLVITAFLSMSHAQDEASANGISFDGLVQVEDAQVAMAYIDPDAGMG